MGQRREIIAKLTTGRHKRTKRVRSENNYRTVVGTRDFGFPVTDMRLPAMRPAETCCGRAHCPTVTISRGSSFTFLGLTFGMSSEYLSTRYDWTGRHMVTATVSEKTTTAAARATDEDDITRRTGTASDGRLTEKCTRARQDRLSADYCTSPPRAPRRGIATQNAYDDCHLLRRCRGHGTVHHHRTAAASVNENTTTTTIRSHTRA